MDSAYLSSPAKLGLPPANFMREPMTTFLSCATSNAALSHVSSAALSQRIKASSTISLITGSIPTCEECVEYM